MQNTIDILSSINITVKEIAKSMAPQNGSGEAAMNKLSKGNVTTNADVNPAADVAKPNISKANIGDIISVLNTLSPSVLNIAKLSRSQIKRFTKVLDSIIKSVNKLSECAKNNKDAVDNVKIIIESFDILNDSVGKGTGLVVKAPIATLGLKLANGTIKAIDAILTTVSKMSNVNERIKKLNNITKAIDPLIKVVTKAALLVGLCMGLGILLMAGPTKDLIIGGLLVLGGIMLTVVGAVGIVGLAASMLGKLDAIKAIDQIMNIVFKSTALVAVCMALGYLIMNGPTREIILGGLAVLGGVIVAVTSIILLTGLASKIIGKVGAFKGIKEIMTLTLASVALVALCFGLGMVIDSMGGWEPLKKGLIAVGGTLLLLGVIFFVVGLVGLLATSKPVMKGLKGIFLMTIGSMVLIIGAKYLGDFVLEHYDRILLGLGSTIVVIGALLAIGWVAGKALASARQGLIALAAVEALAVGAAGLIYILTEVHKKRSDAGVSWDDIDFDVLSISVILAYVGALSFAASSILQKVILGCVAIGFIDLALLGSILLAERMVQFHKVKEDAGVSWGDIELDILGMAAALGTFSVLGGVVAVASIPLIVATPAMAVMAGFALTAIDVVKAVVSLHKAIESVGGSDVLEKTLSVDVPKIISNINAENFDSDMGILTMIKVAAKYKVMAELVSGVLDVAESVSKIANIMGMVDDQGRVSPIISKNIFTGEVKYGEPVDLVNVAKIIGDTVQKFVEGCQFSFTDILKMYNAAEIFHVIGVITDPIAKFVDMLTGYKESGEGMISKITIDEKGEVKIGKPVNIKDVAVVIAGAITSFVSELYKKENTENWAELIYGDRTFFEGLFGQTNKRADSVREVAGILGVIIEPICKFVDMVSGLMPGSNGTLRKIYVDKDGNIQTGPEVDVKKTGNVIADLITSFVTAVYKDADSWKDINFSQGTSLDKLLKPINDMVKSAVEMSSEKIKADLIRSNSDAIVYANSQLITSISAIDVETMNTKVAVIQSVLKIAGSMSNLTGERILSNSKSIVSFMTDVVDNKIPKSKPTVDAFTKSIENLKKSFKDLDTILIKDENKRTKALDEFEKRIKEIINTFKDGKLAMDSYNETLKNTQNYKTPDYIPTQPSYVQTPYAPTQQNNTVNQSINNNNNNNVTFDASKFAEAFVQALKTNGLKFTPDGSDDNGVMPVKITTAFKIG